MENSLDFDVFVMEFQKDDKSLGSISITKEDLGMISLHGLEIKDIAADMANQLMESIQNGTVEAERED